MSCFLKVDEEANALASAAAGADGSLTVGELHFDPAAIHLYLAGQDVQVERRDGTDAIQPLTTIWLMRQAKIGKCRMEADNGAVLSVCSVHYAD